MIRAVNQAVPAQFDDSGPQTLRNASATNTQAINVAEGSAKGFFADPDAPLTDFYVGVTGTTSVLSTTGGDAPGLAWMDGNGNEQDTTFNTSNGGDGTFEGTLDISSYTFDDPTLPPADADQLVVRAVTDTTSAVEDQTDDFEALHALRADAHLGDRNARYGHGARPGPGHDHGPRPERQADRR